MKNRLLKGSILALLLTLSLLVVACGNTESSNEKNNNENVEVNVNDENVEAEENMQEEETVADTSEEDEIEEDSEEVEEAVEAMPLENSAFLFGDMGVSITSAETFIENEELGLVYAEGKGYLLIKGTVTNNGEEEASVDSVGYVRREDDLGNQAGIANSWIDAEGIAVRVAPSEEKEFTELLLYNSEASRITISFEADDEAVGDYVYYVDVTEASEDAAAQDSANSDEMYEILETTSNDILGYIANHEYENIVELGYYTFIAPNLEMETSDSLWFEDYNWEEANTSNETFDFGVDYEGNVINMTYNEFFDTYINAFDFANSEPEIKQERVEYYYNTPDTLMTHYVKYTDGDHVLYFYYEEEYFNEFALSGIGFGIEE